MIALGTFMWCQGVLALRYRKKHKNRKRQMGEDLEDYMRHTTTRLDEDPLQGRDIQYSDDEEDYLDSSPVRRSRHSRHGSTGSAYSQTSTSRHLTPAQTRRSRGLSFDPQQGWREDENLRLSARMNQMDTSLM